MKDFLICLLTSKLFLINWILGILMVEYALKKSKVLIKIYEKRDSKYKSYRRTDIKHWKRPLLYLGAFMILPKILLCGGTLPLLGIFIKIVIIGHKPGTPL